MNLTLAQREFYFEARFPGQQIAAGKDITLRCPLHDDNAASFSLNVDKGAWKCHAGCGHGGYIEFEKLYSNCDSETAFANIAAICSLPHQGLFKQEPEAVYSYRDEDGKILFEKIRYPGKKFQQRAIIQGKHVYNLGGIRRVLYNLPGIITANHVAICEGEKDADRVNSLDLGSYSQKGSRFAATTNFDGAGKWRPEYSPYLTGKRVVIIPDNDDIGRAHATNIASSISPFAASVQVLSLPDLQEKGDVSDFLITHDAKDLVALIRKTPQWKPTKEGLLIQAPQFLSAVSPEIDWLVEGVIQRGANGFISASPKVGKSWLALDLVLSLALGQQWVGFNVGRPIKTALVSREDNPGLTRWRMDRLLAGRGMTRADLDDRLFINSRDQSQEFRIDRDELLLPMIAELKSVKPELVIFDVFNVLHSAEENDNTQMRAILDELNRVQREVGCAIGVVHHFSKATEGNLTQRLRGASAISGWAEWLIGVQKVDDTLRKMEFELKAAEPPEPVIYRVRSDDKTSFIERTEDAPQTPRNALSAVFG